MKYTAAERSAHAAENRVRAAAYNARMNAQRAARMAGATVTNPAAVPAPKPTAADYAIASRVLNAAAIVPTPLVAAAPPLPEDPAAIERREAQRIDADVRRILANAGLAAPLSGDALPAIARTPAVPPAPDYAALAAFHIGEMERLAAGANAKRIIGNYAPSLLSAKDRWDMLPAGSRQILENYQAASGDPSRR